MSSPRVITYVVAGTALALASMILPASSQADPPAKGVLVINDRTNPVPVKPTAPEVVTRTRFGTFPSGSRFSDTVELFTVPQGKMLVIQTVSITSNLTGPDQHLMHVLVSATADDFIPFTINVQPVAEGFFASTGANIFRKTEGITAYAAAGTVVSAVGTRDGTNINSLDSLGVGIVGYLVDTP